MTKSLILGTILGGLVAFLWSSVSWELLQWHEKPLMAFQNEDEVSAMIFSHTTESGTYLLPYGPRTEGMSKEQKKAAEEATFAKMQKGPIMFAAVRRGGFGSFAQGLLVQLLSEMAAAFLLTWLLLQTHGLSYGKSVVFLGVVGLTAGVIVALPDMNWWGFSASYTWVNVADFAITWLIAGLVIAKVADPRTA